MPQMNNMLIKFLSCRAGLIYKRSGCGVILTGGWGNKKKFSKLVCIRMQVAEQLVLFMFYGLEINPDKQYHFSLQKKKLYILKNFKALASLYISVDTWIDL